VPSLCTLDEPPERRARPPEGRATFQIHPLHPQHPEPRATLQLWLEAIPALAGWPLTPLTRLKLEHCARIGLELSRVLEGTEEGEGTGESRTLHAASCGGRIQALSSMFACPGGTFVELLVSAPWNLLAPGDPRDERTVRGAGTALVAWASAWSRARGCGGRVALQAENTPSLRYYERLGFTRLTAADGPLSVVPPGARGHSPSILRVAGGCPGEEERRMPWLLLDPGGQAAARADAGALALAS
jgi:acetyltransferase (GNAT) family protein